MYYPIEIDREAMTIMGVVFPNLETLNSAADAIDSNMYEGFEPTQKLIQFYLDYSSGKIENSQFLSQLKAVL